MTAVVHMELLGSSGMQIDGRNEKNKKRKEGKKVGKKGGWKGGKERKGRWKERKQKASILLISAQVISRNYPYFHG